MSDSRAPTDSRDLDALIRRVDPDRWLSSRFIPDPQARADTITLYAFDHELARAPRTASNPLLGEVRLTWWREALDEIVQGRPPRQHPTVLALAAVLARGVLTASSLEVLIDARYRELDAAPMALSEARSWADDTGGRIATLVAGLLDPATDPSAAQAAGAAWALSWRLEAQPDLASARAEARRQARLAVRSLSITAFPAVAHAVLGAARKGEADILRKARVTWAVARGRI